MWHGCHSQVQGECRQIFVRQHGGTGEDLKAQHKFPGGARRVALGELMFDGL